MDLLIGSHEWLFEYIGVASQYLPFILIEQVYKSVGSQGGLLAVLQWLRSQNPPCPWDARTFSAAVENGKLAY